MLFYGYNILLKWVKYERQNYIQENILIAILLRYPRHYQVLIRYCFDLVYIMLIHSFVHSIVEFVQKLNKLQCTKTKRFDFNRFKNIFYPKNPNKSVKDAKWIRIFAYLQCRETSINPSTAEKYKVALSNVSATVVAPPSITFSMIAFGSIFIISFSCFFFCFFMSSDFLSTLMAKTYTVHNVLRMVLKMYGSICKCHFTLYCNLPV